MSSLGYKHSAETRAKISNAKKGNTCTRGRTLSSEHRAKIGKANSGEKSYYWKGGVSFGKYCKKFNEEFKVRVRNFFGNMCVECGQKSSAEKLHVHHVNFDKMSCCNDTIPLFVALCRKCHGKTQSNREYWELHFTKIIEEKYEGKCYYEKEVSSC